MLEDLRSAIASAIARSKHPRSSFVGVLLSGILCSASPLLAQASDLGSGGAPAESRAILSRARALLDAQMPVTASTLLARELSTGGVYGDEAVLLAARAFADQRSWASTRRLLVDRDFATAPARRQADLLLARAYSGLDSLAKAAELYRGVLDETDGTPLLAVRIDLAEVEAGRGRWSAARAQLEAAEAERPDLARWIRLSRLYLLVEAEDVAAYALADSLAATGRVPADSVWLPVARMAFDLDDDERGTAIARRAGDGVWNRLAARHIGPHLLRVGDERGAAAAFAAGLEAGVYTAGTGPALLDLVRSWQTLRDVGQSDLRRGRNERGADYLREALEIAPASERRSIAQSLAGAELALGNAAAAETTLAPWIGPEASGSATASMWTLASRIYGAQGRSGDAAAARQRAAEGGGNAGALAAYLLADEHHDAGRAEEAAVGFDLAFSRHSGSSYGSRSLERLAMLAFHEERYDDARAHLDTYRRTYPRGGWFQGATYWIGRTEEAKGDVEAARGFYLEAFSQNPLDYYAILAAPRIGRDRWAAVGVRESQPLPDLHPVYADALSRMNTLRDLGWPNRARRDYREARDRGPADRANVLAFAHALNEWGWTQEGIREGWRAQARGGGWSRSLLAAIYPLPFQDALKAAAEDRGLPPHFVAGLSRRESMFDPEIMSVANAVGIMQLLPETARDVAPRAGLPEYRRSQLTVPEVNLKLGTQYLADVLNRFGGAPIAGMISYNAGPHRFVRWREFPEFSDDEQLVERIPFRETREYVRAVTELAEIYRFLYPELDPPTP